MGFRGCFLAWASCRAPIERLVRGFQVGGGGGVPCGVRVRTGPGWSGRCGGRAARGGPQVLPFVLAVPVFGQVKGKVPSAVASGAGGDAAFAAK